MFSVRYGGVALWSGLGLMEAISAIISFSFATNLNYPKGGHVLGILFQNYLMKIVDPTGIQQGWDKTTLFHRRRTLIPLRTALGQLHRNNAP